VKARDDMFRGERAFSDAHGVLTRVRTDSSGVWVRPVGSRGPWKRLEWRSIAGLASKVMGVALPASLQASKDAAELKVVRRAAAAALNVGDIVRMKPHPDEGPFIVVRVNATYVEMRRQDEPPGYGQRYAADQLELVERDDAAEATR